MPQTKYIFVTGGVTSSLGKGIIAASLAKLLQARGYRTTIQKLDPYINVDPGTLNPYEHGECYVTDDGAELATPANIPHADRYLPGEIEEALAAHPIDAFTRVVVVTRNVALDASLLPLLLATPTPTIGLMGSTRRWATTRQLLIEAGIDAELLGKIRTPVGIEIGAETPREIAVSILAELIDEQPGSP